MPSTSLRWVDRSQPQTLMMATIILYINAALSLLDGAIFGIGLVLVIGQVAAALGIANEKKWGYWLGVALAALFVILIVAYFSFVSVINLIFYVALLALLLHRQSRSYFRTWFHW
jgi:MFS superfamily sulfate permease-like transporter